jgi:hypothetical protein
MAIGYVVHSAPKASPSRKYVDSYSKVRNISEILLHDVK